MNKWGSGGLFSALPGTRCELSFAQTMSKAYMYIQTVDNGVRGMDGGATTCTACGVSEGGDGVRVWQCGWASRHTFFLWLRSPHAEEHSFICGTPWPHQSLCTCQAASLSKTKDAKHCAHAGKSGTRRCIGRGTVAPSSHVRVVPTKAPSGGPTDIRQPLEDLSTRWAPEGPR